MGSGLPFTNTPPSWFTSPNAGSGKKKEENVLNADTRIEVQKAFKARLYDGDA